MRNGRCRTQPVGQRTDPLTQLGCGRARPAGQCSRWPSAARAQLSRHYHSCPARLLRCWPSWVAEAKTLGHTNHPTGRAGLEKRVVSPTGAGCRTRRMGTRQASVEQNAPKKPRYGPTQRGPVASCREVFPVRPQSIL